MTLLDATPFRPRRRTTATGLRAMDEEQLAVLAEELCGSPVPGVRMTEQEFVDWSFERVDAEWVDGEVILVAPANNEHESIDEWFGRLLGNFLEEFDAGVLRRNMFVRLARQRSRRVPDLMVIKTASQDRVKPTYINGPPDVVVEIVSPDSRNRDRREKFFEYEASGVREYWIIDPLARAIDLYALVGRRYRDLDPVDGQLRSTVLDGFYLRTAWLFGNRRPKVATVLKEFARGRTGPSKTRGAKQGPKRASLR